MLLGWFQLHLAFLKSHLWSAFGDDASSVSGQLVNSGVFSSTYTNAFIPKVHLHWYVITKCIFWNLICGTVVITRMLKGGAFSVARRAHCNHAVIVYSFWSLSKSTILIDKTNKIIKNCCFIFTFILVYIFAHVCVHVHVPACRHTDICKTPKAFKAWIHPWYLSIKLPVLRSNVVLSN